MRILALLVTLLLFVQPASSIELRGGAEPEDEASWSDNRRLGQSQWNVRFITLTYNQPMDPIFVVVHNSAAKELFTLGGVAGAGLKLLAEEGDAATLIAQYSGAMGVKSVQVAGTTPIFLGQYRDITVNTDENYRNLRSFVSVGVLCSLPLFRVHLVLDVS
jgi:hypothetical protein